MPRIKITRTYTLPHSREGRGRPEVESDTYDADDWRTVQEWAADTLRDAGCTRHSWGPRYITEEPKITDFARGEEVTAMAELSDFTDTQLMSIYRQMTD